MTDITHNSQFLINLRIYTQNISILYFIYNINFVSVFLSLYINSWIEICTLMVGICG